eukprot:symbB.v1.2.025391.t1/scaffold2460.1/size78709/3
MAVHCSPAFEPKEGLIGLYTLYHFIPSSLEFPLSRALEEEGDIITAGQCRPLAKTVRFNVIKVDKNQIFGSARKQFALF